MSASGHIVEVNEGDFQYEVLAYSNQTPVVVDFWAEWCQPCKLLSPILEKLAQEGRGAFRLAKVDVDANPNLTIQYQVQGIPAVKAFRNGAVVAEFSGARSEPEVRDFLRKLAPGPGDLALDKGISLLAGGNWDQAAQAFGTVLNSSPDNAAALLGLAKSHLAQGKLMEALPILRAFPASKEYSVAEQLIPLAEALDEIQHADAGDPDDEWFAAYQQSLRLVDRGNLPAAIDGLLDILRANKHYRKGEIRKLIVALLHVLGEDNPQTKEYRTELASLLF
jgi:putative thioredoxin